MTDAHLKIGFTEANLKWLEKQIHQEGKLLLKHWHLQYFCREYEEKDDTLKTECTLGTTDLLMSICAGLRDVQVLITRANYL